MNRPLFWRFFAGLMAILLYLFLGPRAEAAWSRLNHNDPVLEVLAALLIIIVLSLGWIVVHMFRSKNPP